MKEFLLFFSTMEGAFFFVIPVLFLFAPGQSHSYRTRTSTWVLLFLGLFLFLASLTLFSHTHVSRYFFTSVLLVSCFCGGGFSGITQWLTSLTRCPAKYGPFIIGGLVIIACTITVLKSACEKRKHYVKEFADLIISESNGKAVTIVGIDCHDGKKIMTRIAAGRRNVLNIEFSSWSQAARELPNLSKKDAYGLFFFFSLPEQHSFDSFREQFRSEYYVFPFDLAGAARYRKKCYYLLHFNGRTGDGIIRKESGSLLSRIPAPLRLKKNQENLFDFSSCIPDLRTPTDDFILGTTANYSWSWSFSWGIIPQKNLSEVVFTYYNSLFWPLASATRSIVDSEASEAAAKSVDSSPFPCPRSERPSDAPPLVIVPPTVYLASDAPWVYLTGAVPAEGREYRFQYFTVNSPDPLRPVGKRLALSAGTRQVSVEVRDKILNTKKMFSFQVVFSNPETLKPKRLSLFMISDCFSKNMNLCKYLKEQLSANSSITELIQPNGISDIPEEKHKMKEFWRNLKDIPPRCDAIIVNCLIWNIIAPRVFPFDSDGFRREINDYVRMVREKIPDVPLVFLIPPPPADYCRFPISGNGRLNRLAYYRLACTLIDTCANQEKKKVFLLPLTFSLDPGNGYLRVSKSSDLLMAPYVISPEGRQSIGNTILSWLAHYYSDSVAVAPD